MDHDEFSLYNWREWEVLKHETDHYCFDIGKYDLVSKWTAYCRECGAEISCEGDLSPALLLHLRVNHYFRYAEALLKGEVEVDEFADICFNWRANLAFFNTILTPEQSNKKQMEKSLWDRQEKYFAERQTWNDQLLAILVEQGYIENSTNPRPILDIPTLPLNVRVEPSCLQPLRLGMIKVDTIARKTVRYQSWLRRNLLRELGNRYA